MTTILEGRSARERMATVLDALSYGLVPGADCIECLHSHTSRCYACAAALTYVGSVAAAIDSIRSATTDEEALAAYQSCLLELAAVS